MTEERRMAIEVLKAASDFCKCHATCESCSIATIYVQCPIESERLDRIIDDLSEVR